MFSMKWIYNYSNQQGTCLSVSFTACLTSLIFQQYNKGFNEEFR